MFETLFQALNEFHFLRPWWLVALLPAMLFSWLLFRQQHQAGRWQSLIQADLLPFLLDAQGRQQQGRYFLWALLFWCLATVAIAGPSWSKIPLPIHKQQNPLVILLDLSPSMLAEDLKPNRLTRARLKLTDFLLTRKEGTTALIAYANDAHVVTPLTDDTATIISLVPSLHPNIMPAAGSNPIKAVNKGLEIILQAGHQNGDLLLISDGINRNDAESINSLLKTMGGFRLSVLALGSEDGAPIPAQNGGFVKDQRGDIVIARRDSEVMRQVAQQNRGRYADLSTDDRDLEYLGAELGKIQNDNTQQLERSFDTWQDNGFWLALLALPLVLAAFRRNLITLILVSPLLLSSEKSQAFDWADLWQTPDQQGQKAFRGGDINAAEEHFKNPSWKGSAAYRNENYDAAIEAFAGDPSPVAQYNRANSLARTGQLEEALQAYEQVLSTEPDHADAAFNKKLVGDLLKQEQNQNQNKDSSDQQSDQKPGDEDNQQDSKQEENSSRKDKSQENQSSSNEQQNPQSEQDQDTSDGEQKDQQQNQQGNNDQQENQPGEPKNTKDDEKANQPASNQGQQDLSKEQRQAMEQWLRRVPDDPGGLLRRKFEYEAWQQQSGKNKANRQETQRW